MENNYFDLSDIEEFRKKKIDKMIAEMVDRRQAINKELEKEINEIYSDFLKDPGNNPTKMDIIETDHNIKEAINTHNGGYKDISYENNQVLLHNSYFPSSHPQNDPQGYSKTTYSANSSFKHELVPSNTFIANVSLTDVFLNTYILTDAYIAIENNILKEKENMSKQDKVKIKLMINKCLNLLNDDMDKIEEISRSFEAFKNSYTFIESFTLKMIDHSIVKINRLVESYGRYSKLFYLVYSNELFSFYRVNVLSKRLSDESIKGLYILYFSILKDTDNLDEVWCFISSLLNAPQSDTNQYVVEAFLFIFDDFLKYKIPKSYNKLLRYIQEFYLSDMSDASCKFRVKEYINKSSR